MDDKMYKKFEQKQIKRYYTQKPAKEKILKPLFDIEN
jgi:hypothetical protein